MSKTKRINELTVFIAVIIVCAGLLFTSNLIHLQQSQADVETYKNAAFCDDRDDCRKEVQAMVLNSLTVRFDVSSGKYMTEQKSKITAYQISIKLSDGETHLVKILPNLNLNTNEFKLNNIYLPAPKDPYEKMAEISFKQGSTINIELWKHKPTILYASTVPGAPALQQGDEYALPTRSNPLVYGAIAQSDFTGVTVILGFAILLLVAVQLFLKQKPV